MMMLLLLAAATQAGSLPVQTVVHDASRARAQTKTQTRTQPRAPAASQRLSGRLPVTTLPRVVIDAGHGGVDVGGQMHSRARVHEKDITLQVALRLGEELRQRAVDVVFTRKKDTLIALDDRGRIANRSNGTSPIAVFISIHVNAANPRWREPAAARGFETYFLAEAKTEDARRVEEMENASVRFEESATVPADDALKFILSDMKQNEHLRESSDLADIVQRHLGEVHPGPNRGVKQAGFRVLVSAFMPSVLVELGFGTNESEAEFLASSAKQRIMARAIADATMEYLERYQKRVSGGAATAPGSHD